MRFIPKNGVGLYSIHAWYCIITCLDMILALIHWLWRSRIAAANTEPWMLCCRYKCTNLHDQNESGSSAANHEAHDLYYCYAVLCY
jgi:hypothetical protein